MHLNFAKSPHKGLILFDVRSVFCNRGRAYYTDLASCQCRFEEFPGTSTAGSVTFARCDEVNLVDEQYQILGLLSVIEDPLDPLLELSFVTCSRRDCAEIQAQKFRAE